MMEWPAIFELFPFMAKLDPAAQAQLQKEGTRIQINDGESFHPPDGCCDAVPLMLSGVLRICKISESGREVTLFRAYPGDVCLLNLTRQLQLSDFHAFAVAEDASQLLLIPSGYYQRWLKNFIPWKDYLITILYKRLGETMEVLEQVAFTKADKRLAHILYTLSKGQNTALQITHEQLAIELGTAREVVSRLLSELKRQGIITQKRGSIEILDSKALQQIIR